MRVKHAVVVITGASSGIGRATAHAFARRRAAVVLSARREDALTTLAHECEQRGGQALVVPAEVTEPKAVAQVAQRAVEQFGRIDIWINNAAVTMFAPFLDVPLADFRRVLDVNILGYVNGARAALPLMREQGTGILINVSSVVGQVPQPYTSAYSMSKAAIRSLGGSLRSELWLDGMHGVKVCTVLPATIDTPFFRHAANYTGREVVPMPPVYSPQRVARAIVNLARLPRREVTAGSMSGALRLQHQLMPGRAERMFARQVDRRHLSQTRPAPGTSGNLYEPSTDPRDAVPEGGWGGRRRTVLRGAAALAAVGVTATMIVRRMRRHEGGRGC